MLANPTQPMGNHFLGHCIPTQPLVFVSSHGLSSSSGTPFYFTNGLSMPAPHVRPLPSFVEASSQAFGPAQPLLSSSAFPRQFPSLAVAPNPALLSHSNEMQVDEPIPTSPSSSNSTEQEDEDSAVAILHMMETGSISPRGSPRSQNLQSPARPTTVQGRRPSYPFTTAQASWTANRRTKRVSSISEISSSSCSDLPLMAGKEDAFSDDIELSSSAMVTSPMQSRANTSGMDYPRTAPSSPATRTPGGRQMSWSVPSTTAFTFAQQNYAAQMSPTSTPKHATMGALPSSQPISIPPPKLGHTSYGPYGSHSTSSLPVHMATSPNGGSKKLRRTPRARLENHQCPNCHTSDSPLWRNCLIKGKVLHLCNSCGLRYKKHKYCPHCYKVYYDAETNVQDWAQCMTCHNWTHRHCLNSAGIDTDALGAYKCLRCLGLLPDCD